MCFSASKLRAESLYLLVEAAVRIYLEPQLQCEARVQNKLSTSLAGKACSPEGPRAGADGPGSGFELCCMQSVTAGGRARAWGGLHTGRGLRIGQWICPGESCFCIQLCGWGGSDTAGSPSCLR